MLGILGGEAGIRMLFQGNAIRVGPTQYPLLWGLHIENCATFGWTEIPELYVTQTPVFNAGAYGDDAREALVLDAIAGHSALTRKAARRGQH